LAVCEGRYVNVVYDMTVPEQEKQARSDRLAIGKKIAELDRVHAAVKAPLKAQVDLLDGERKRIKDGLLDIQEGVKSQIAAHEASVAAIEFELVSRVDAIKALAEFSWSPTSDQVMDRIVTLKKITVDNTLAHHEGAALIAHRDTLAHLQNLYKTVSQAEADAAELARLKAEAAERERAEHEARIAAEAAERAKREAEEAAAKAEREKREAAERAEREKAEAVARAERETQEKAEKVERERLAAIEAEKREQEAREADYKHRTAIENAAYKALLSIEGMTEPLAVSVMEAIMDGEIPNIKIHY
jgi:colicin import membrane protein